MMSDHEILEQVRAVFFEEQKEHCQAMTSLLTNLETEHSPEQHEKLIRQIFRESHGLKGGARAAQFHEIEQIAHVLEEVFTQAQQNPHLIQPSLIKLFQQAVDTITILSEYYATKQTIPSELYQPILQQLQRQLSDAPIKPPSVQPSSTPPTEPEETVPIYRQKERIRVPLALLDTIMHQAGELQAYVGDIHRQMEQGSTLEQYFARWNRIWLSAQPAINVLKSIAHDQEPIVHFLNTTSDRQPQSEYGEQYLALRSLYSTLLNINQFMFDFKNHARISSQQFHERYNIIHNLTQRLFQDTRRTRMQKMAVLYQPLTLSVNELAQSTHKKLQIHFEGADIEADTQILEQLHEVLLHLLRNAIDHGIESTDQRRILGKPEHGQIYMSASVHGERLVVEVSDDGAGLDEEAIRLKAISVLGISDTEWQNLDTSSRLSFIFRPGFSTRDAADTLSGRGVGLDIVRMQVERMQGVIEIEHILGNGCLFRMILPVSLSNLHAFVVLVGTSLYALSFHAVMQIILVHAEDLIDQQPYTLINLADRQYPVVLLSQWLELESGPTEPVERWYGLLIGSADRQIVCLVDEVLGEQELLVQRLPFPYHSSDTISGASILANGTVVPIFNITDILQHPYQQYPTIKQVAQSKQEQVVLIVDDSQTTRTLLRLILEQAGFVVQSANSGIEASHLLTQSSEAPIYNLVISDIDMPDMNGFELTTWIRAQAHIRHVPIILLTSLNAPSEYKRGIAVGADAYMTKQQFDQQLLLQTIYRLI